MTIREFTDGYKDGKGVLADHIVNHYSPVNTKLVIAEGVVKQMYTEQDGKKIRNSVARRLLQAVNFVLMYTDFERTENLVDEYDAVTEFHLVEQVIDWIEPNEWDEFDNLMDITCEDYEYNSVEPHNYVSEQIERFGSLIGASLGPVLEGINWDELIGGFTSPNSEGGTTEL